jgi:hypothetical protein
MSPRSFTFLTAALCFALMGAGADDKTLTKIAKGPAGVSAPIAAAVDPHGYGVQAGQKTVCEVWLLRDLARKPKFKPTLQVKYPFQSGELIGVLRVDAPADFTDFRGQAVKPGVYTLRYGQQPQDGNHIGTSETADFLVAIPAATDTELKSVVSVEHLHQASAKTVGGNHPAIFPLLPAESSITEASLSKDDNNRWVLGVPAQGTQAGKRISLPFRMVVVGKVEG